MFKIGRIEALVIVWFGWGVPLAFAAERIHRQPLGEGNVFFLRGQASVRYEIKEHRISRDHAHKGDASETIRIVAERADPASEPFIHFVYPTPRAPMTPELKAGLWLRSKSSGIQLLARVVLPHVRNPQRPESARTVFIEGPRYSHAHNWQRLDLGDALSALRRQVQILRLEMGMEIDVSDAYVDQLVLNLFTGEGEVQVWINEIEIGPVLGDRPTPPTSESTSVESRTPRTLTHVEIVRDQLTVDGRRFFFRGIRLTDTPVEVHRRAGFNTLFLEPTASQLTIDELTKLELFAVPMLALPDLDEGVLPVARSELLPRETLSRLHHSGRLLFWHLGDDRGEAQLERVARLASRVREVDPDRPVGVDASEALWPYSRHVDLLGVHRWPLHTGLELTQYRDWLRQRRFWARPGTFTWTWVQTHLPAWHTQLVYQRPPTSSFDEPIGPQPEQIRLLTYLAVASGCRGIAFSSDRFLADTHQGRDRLLAVALLNLELQMLEPILLSLMKPPLWIDTSHPNVKAAVLHAEKGILVLPIWLGPGSQCVPGQASAAGLRLVVPMVPPNFQPWEVSPVEVRTLTSRRIAGGTEIVLGDFDLTAAIVFTSDMSTEGPVVSWQQQMRRMAESASGWSVDLARAELDKVRRVNVQLTESSAARYGDQVLLRDAERRWQSAQALHQSRRYREAYLEAHRALRPVRQLMRWQWERALAEAGTPTATPYLVSYYTLPKQKSFMESLARARAGENLLTGGGFESPQAQGWSISQSTEDEVQMAARLGIDKPHEGARYLELAVVPREGKNAPEALERTIISATSDPVRLPPGTLVRICGWVRIPRPISASPDGALFYDSAGGEPLAVRLTEATDWRLINLYRRVPASGEVRVTIGMTGLGVVQWDDVRIEPLFEATGN